MKTVPLHGPKAAGRVALVNDRDYALVSQYRWMVMEKVQEGHRTKGPYAVANIYVDGRRKLTSMHKLITGWPLTDHKNHDGLDNRRRNLRPATQGQNLQHTRPHLGARSQYKGVTWSSSRQLWLANIGCQGKKRFLGSFRTEKAAALAYDAAARECHGEFAVLNFPVVNRHHVGAARGSYDAHRDRIRALVRETAAKARSQVSPE